MKRTAVAFMGALAFLTGNVFAATGSQLEANPRTEIKLAAAARIYGTLAMVPVPDRRAVFRGLSAAMKAEVWRVQFRNFSVENSLSPAQLAVMAAAQSLFTEELYATSKADPAWESQVHEPLLRLEQSARNIFPPDLLFEAFGQLGPSDTESTAAAINPSEPRHFGRGLTPIPQQVSECTCSEASDMCWWGSSCGGSICYRSADDSGCGFGWAYECSGKCHRN